MPKGMSSTEERLGYEAILAWLREQPQGAQQDIIRLMGYMSGYNIGWRKGRLVVKDHATKLEEPDLPGVAIKGMGVRTALCVVYAIARRMWEME